MIKKIAPRGRNGVRGRTKTVQEDKEGIEMAGWDIWAEEMYLMSDLSTTSNQNNGPLCAIVLSV